MNRPSWDNFIGKNFGNKREAMEALARLLFRTRYGLGDSLPYFKNHPGNETEPIEYNGEIIGFQSKYFEDGKIDADQMLHSLEKVIQYYPNQNRYIIYTNSEFGAGVGNQKPVGLQRIESLAQSNNITVEWIYRENVLDLVQGNELAYNLFFNPLSHLHHLQQHISEHNEIELKSIHSNFLCKGELIAIDRSQQINRIAEAVANNCSLIITGESGSGKSAIVKDFCEKIKDKEEYALFIINASALAVQKVSDIFNLQENYSLGDFGSYYEGCDRKIVAIDSAEKLLELRDSTSARLFIDHLYGKGWNFILTCKSNAEKDLTDLLKLICDIDYESLNVDVLSDEYLAELFQRKKINKPEDKKLYKQLHIPFYLSRYCESISDNKIDAAQFREIIWDQKVLGLGTRSSRIKRGECLLDIVEKLQARNLYVLPYRETDIDSASTLVESDILGDYPHKGYFVKHDIYSDWALDYVISNKFENTENIQSMLNSRDISIQYVNAFKRWLIEEITKDSKEATFVTNAVFDKQTHIRLRQAIFECIGSSASYADKWFEENEDKLSKDNYAVFNEFIDILCVSCNEIDQYLKYKGKEYPIMKPIGSGWVSAIEYAWNNMESYYLTNLVSVQKLIHNFSGFKDKADIAKYHAGLMTLKIFQIMAASRIKGESFWFGNNEKHWAGLVCKYALTIKDELKEVFRQVIENKWIAHTDPYSELCSYILKDTESIELLPMCLVCKDEIIKLLELFWNEKKVDDDFYSSYRHRDSDFAFGLNEDFEGVNAYFPSSALQTPIYTLLTAESMMLSKENKVISFIINFVDKHVDIFKQRGFANEVIGQIDVKLRDGRKHLVYTSSCLWNIYRGTSGLAMPNLMESMHMALEKYLLECAERNNEFEKVGNLLWYILENAHSCSLYAIVASVAMAHYEEFFEQLLFLMQDVEFLTMDLMRHTREFHANGMSFAYHRYSSLWKERDASNKLKHRNYHLEDLLMKLQVLKNNGEEQDILNRLYAIVDYLKEQVNSLPEDERHMAKYVILRIDERAMKKEPVQVKDGVVGIQYTPVLTPEMEKEQEDLQKNSLEMMRGMKLRHWVESRFKGNFDESKKFEYDNDIQTVLNDMRIIKKQVADQSSNIYTLIGDEFVPYMTCSVLLQQFKSDLSVEEKDECLEIVFDALSSPDFLMSSSLSSYEICLATLPELLVDSYRVEDLENIIVLYAQMTSEMMNRRPCDLVFNIIRQNNFWYKYPVFMSRVLDKYKESISVKDFSEMTMQQAESLLCLLSSKNNVRDNGFLCMQKIAEFWKPEDRRHHSHIKGNFYAAYLIAEYILSAPETEVKELIKPFKPYINAYMNYDNLIAAFVYNCAQYGRYNNFWIVWSEIYDSIIGNVNHYYNNNAINDYLLNPSSLVENAGMWFKLEKENVQFYLNVANDLHDHPSVIYSIAKVFDTIGKNYLLDIIPTIAMVVNSPIHNFDDVGTAVIHYLENMMSRMFGEYDTRRATDMELNRHVVTILDFMVSKGSKHASDYLKQM